MQETNEFTDKVFEALGNTDRRKLLASLIADSPPDGGAQQLPDDDILLYHSHLPKLDNYGFIDWDEDEDTFTRGPNFDQARPFLELLAEHDTLEFPVDGDSVELTVGQQHVQQSDSTEHVDYPHTNRQADAQSPDDDRGPDLE